MNERFWKVVSATATVVVGVPCAILVELVGVVVKAFAWAIVAAVVGIPLWILIGSLATGKTGWVKPQTDVDRLTQTHLGHE